jgi:hypothetical protein
MARDDWRVVVTVGEHEGHGLLDRLRAETAADATELAQALRRRRLAVSQDGDEIFLYAGYRTEAQAAKELVEALAREHDMAVTVGPVEQWLPDEERWDHEPPDETPEEDALEQGYAPWEVRIPTASHEQARELADRLEADGYGVTRRWRYVIAGVATEDEARALAARLHGDVELGGELVWEAMPGNPFAVFGGMGGAGTPL